jgi:hypothetical protein
MIEQLEPLCRGTASVIVRDVDISSEWTERYGLDVPVLMLDGVEVCRHRFDEAAFVAAMNRPAPKAGKGA